MQMEKEAMILHQNHDKRLPPPSPVSDTQPGWPVLTASQELKDDSPDDDVYPSSKGQVGAE